MQTGTQLRHLFATLLLFCSSSQPELLWVDFQQHICDDLTRKLAVLGIADPSEADIFDYGLYLLDDPLQQSWKCLANDFPSMPTAQHNWGKHTQNQLIAEQLNYNQNQECDCACRQVLSLNAEQLEAYQLIVKSVEK